MNGEYINYEFSKEPNGTSYDFCICIPNYRDNDLYAADYKINEINECPTWFKEIFDEVEHKINARDRLKNLFDVD